MSWFDYLVQNGFLNPDQNPEPELVEKGYAIPAWGALEYVEKLSHEIKNGKELDKIDALLDFIKNVSENPKDNYRTWYTLIKILLNLPNERITVSLLEFMPVWLSGRFDTMLQSSEIIEKLLPKFLANPTQDNVAKAETIFRHLFDLYRVQDADPLTKPGKSYSSRVYPYYLREAFEKGSLKESIADHLTSDVLYVLLDNINLLLRDFARVTELRKDNINLHIVLVPDGKNYLFTIKDAVKENETVLHESIIENYYETGLQEILELVKKTLINIGITDEAIPAETIRRLLFNLETDFHSIFANKRIHDLHDDNYQDDEPIDIFPFVLSELLRQYAEKKPEEVIKVLHDMTQASRYDVPFYQRMTFYIISIQWEKLKSVFFDMLGENDPKGYFSGYQYENELYYLLSHVQNKLTEEENKLISLILDQGQKIEREFSLKPEVWKHRWLDALKENNYFKSEYERITREHELEKMEYAEEGKVRVMVGSISPYTVEQILEMDDALLLEKILNFKNPRRDQFDQPTIEGFGEQLMKAAEKDPGKFVRYIEHYIQVPYLYIYYILQGITTAWRNKIAFDWKKLLEFCKVYTDPSNALDDTLRLDLDGLSTKRGWVSGTIARLISEGTRKDENAFNETLLPLAKEILIPLGLELKYQENKFKLEKTDYPMVSYNTTAGQVLRGLLDYSLRKVRINNTDQHLPIKWEKEIKDVFDSTFNKGILEGYILLGMYLQQFYYLDRPWMESSVKDFYSLEKDKWLAFVGGLNFSSPANTPEMFELVYPHYKKALGVDGAVDSTYRNGIVRHITAYYWWDYDKLDEKSLMKELVLNSQPDNVSKLIQFLWEQDKHLPGYTEAEQKNIREKTLFLWHLMASRFENDNSDQGDEIIQKLTHLTEYITVLNDETAGLLLKSATRAKDYHSVNDLLEILVRLKSNSNAHLVARILKAIQFSEYMHDGQQNRIRELVIFLFNSGQSEVAGFICNKLTIQGYEFLKDIYFQFSDRKS